MNYNTIVNYFTKVQKKITNVQSILIYFLLLFLFDYSGFMDLYGENIIRRCMHMLKRRDELSYKSKLDPYAIYYTIHLYFFLCYCKKK